MLEFKDNKKLTTKITIIYSKLQWQGQNARTCFLLKSLREFSKPSSSRRKARLVSTVHQICTAQSATWAGGSHTQTSRGFSSYDTTASRISCRTVSLMLSSKRFSHISTYNGRHQRLRSANERRRPSLRKTAIRVDGFSGVRELLHPRTTDSCLYSDFQTASEIALLARILTILYDYVTLVNETRSRTQ